MLLILQSARVLANHTGFAPLSSLAASGFPYPARLPLRLTRSGQHPQLACSSFLTHGTPSGI